MANEVEIKVRLKITLATESFTGRDHTGDAQRAYMLNHPVTIFTQGDNTPMRWMQNKDDRGHYEDRLPPNGLVSLDQTDCMLWDRDRKPVVALSNFTSPVGSSNGTAEYKYKKETYTAQKESTIRWVGRGDWELVKDGSSPPQPSFLFSRWKFKTSASASVGGLVVEFGSGTLYFDDPANVTHRYAYIGGGGSVDLGKVLKLIKALKDLVWVSKLAKATEAATKVSGGSSTEDNFSTGIILKNYLMVGSRELVPTDFLGQCLWVDASAGVYKSIGGMLLLLNVDLSYDIPMFTAVVPCGGVNYTPVAAGLGACYGWISPA